ncbi:MAG TPA: aldose epimerase, partial [Opitutales bacterium]|nr:aldose epimerase [Opitutales bacterium]
VRGGNPVLFPFCGRSYRRGKQGGWKGPDGAVRPMPQHGFARGSKFEIVSTNEQGFVAELKPDDAAREAYPYQYRFTVRYLFDALSFKVYFRLENFDERPLPWSAGHHFYFTLPWHEGLTRKDYRFQIPAKKCFVHAPDGSLDLIKPFDKESDFGRAENSDRIFTKLRDNLAKFGPNNGEEDIGIRFLKDADTYSQWNAFVIWTEAEDSPFYCVEPWMGPPNGPEHRKGLHTVKPGESAEFGVEVALL